MIERTFDAGFFNRICNLPEVRPTLAPGSEPIDVSPILADGNNYALRTEHGGFILTAYGAGFYSVHTQFAAEGRGQHAISAMKAGLEWMFTRTDCMRITSHCPDDNPAAIGLAVKGGAKRWFRKVHDLLGPGVVVSWDIFDWMANTPDNEIEGNAFHDRLEAAKSAMGSELPTHADDPWHDRVVGAALMMAKHGQVRKGISLYNIWSGAAGYATALLLQDNPPVVDVRDAVVGLKGDEMEVLLCR